MKKFEQTNRRLILLVVLIFAQMFQFAQMSTAQTVSKDNSTSSSCLDLQNGMTADQAVAYALENNGEIQALRKEKQAAQASVKQAGLRPNPKLEVSGAKQIGGADNN